MNTKDLIRLGVPVGEAIQLAHEFIHKANTIAGQRDRLANLIESETRFGMGCEFKERREHDVMDEDWSVSPVTQRLHDKAWKQLGTSGSGNHFVEFGAFTVTESGTGILPVVRADHRLEACATFRRANISRCSRTRVRAARARRCAIESGSKNKAPTARNHTSLRQRSGKRGNEIMKAESPFHARMPGSGSI